MTLTERLKEAAEDRELGFLSLPEIYDDAYIGIIHRCGEDPIVAYDYNKCVEALMKANSIERDEAVEFIEYNIENAWVGPQTPALIEDWIPR